ncbi:hypothetical protein C7U92_10280 [Bradyrhizobium sp. WBOS7]|uniref:Uncharacterized protein n=1 Tax=Bradyrhizobium betae TaxID=244734 RepID=A0AAE9N7M5_9BRAD|nr:MULTISPECIES: hypothetical protein [Bradyrhizobium]MDD1573069.1 hypothetical protein [Bradyrhizobium sp. WBOS1]UUO33995.1 hypothetical protein DCK84_05010 [Bradyrhizobium sp. WBOS01]MDD1528562.1 hypothetical protein [Bradyrhizobium sp. WBOS2]MDD1577116.1 hypothetical protein [Bradyrhizobium sp. WBOS7]MDD1600163.1 hypothetical protein [Bradyrhizobium sp. WBOS16]
MPSESVIHFQSKPGATPPTPYDNLPILARKLYKHEEDLAAQSFARYEAKLAGATEIRRQIAEARLEALQNEREPKPSEELAKDCARRIAEGEAELAALDKLYEDENRLLPGGFRQNVWDFAKANALRPLKSHNFECELGDDLVAEHEACRAARAAKLEEAEAVRRAHVPAAVIESAIDRTYSEASTSVQHALRKLRTPNGFSSGRFSTPSLELPMLTIPNGAGGLSRLNDTATLLFAVFGTEIRERLKAMALARHDPENAIPIADRPAMLKKIEAEILEIERKAEFIYRTGRARGINTGPRLAASPLAILDIDFA